MPSRPDHDDERPASTPSRRALVGGGLAAGALGWVAPSVVSAAAAAVGSAAPGPVIDPFTFPASASGLGGQATTVLDPFQGSSVTRRIITATAVSSLTIAGGHATFVASGVGSVTLAYQFVPALDLTAFTELAADCSFTGSLDDLYLVLGSPGTAELVPRLAVQPVARFDLAAVAADRLGLVTSMDVVISATTNLQLTLGPLHLV